MPPPWPRPQKSASLRQKPQTISSPKPKPHSSKPPQSGRKPKSRPVLLTHHHPRRPRCPRSLVTRPHPATEGPHGFLSHPTHGRKGAPGHLPTPPPALRFTSAKHADPAFRGQGALGRSGCRLRFFQKRPRQLHRTPPLRRQSYLGKLLTCAFAARTPSGNVYAHAPGARGSLVLL